MLHLLTQRLQRHDLFSDQRAIVLLDRHTHSRHCSQPIPSIAQSNILHPSRRNRIAISRNEPLSLQCLRERRNALHTNMHRSTSHSALSPTPKRPIPPSPAHTPAVPETPSTRSICFPRDLSVDGFPHRYAARCPGRAIAPACTVASAAVSSPSPRCSCRCCEPAPRVRSESSPDPESDRIRLVMRKEGIPQIAFRSNSLEFARVGDSVPMIALPVRRMRKPSHGSLGSQTT